MADKLSDKHVLGMILFVMSETVFYRQSPTVVGGPTDLSAG
jgi:hypothetical protein